MSANNHLTTVGAGRGDWQTPPDLFARMNARWRFDYDAFASHENALCEWYSTPMGTFVKDWPSHQSKWEGPDLVKESHLDGLSWAPTDDTYPRRRFANPPYSRDIIGPAVEWLARSHEAFDITVGLLPENRDTAWWRSFIKNKATVYSIGRVRYIDPSTGEPGGSPPGGSAIVVWIPEWLDR